MKKLFILILPYFIIYGCSGIKIPNINEEEKQKAYYTLPKVDNKATLCIFRDSSFTGSMLQPTIYINMKKWGILITKEYLCKVLPEGKYAIFANGVGYGASINVDLVANEFTYLFFNGTSQVIMPSDEDFALKCIADSIKHH